MSFLTSFFRAPTSSFASAAGARAGVLNAEVLGAGDSRLRTAASWTGFTVLFGAVFAPRGVARLLAVVVVELFEPRFKDLSVMTDSRVRVHALRGRRAEPYTS